MVQMLIKRWIVRRSKGLIIGYVTDLQQPALYPAWHWVICPASDDVLADYMQKVGESQEELSAEMDYVTEYYTSHSCSPMHGISQTQNNMMFWPSTWERLGSPRRNCLLRWIASC